MKWSDVAPSIGKFAPILGTLIGGPAGAALGAVVASVLGVEATPSAVSEAMRINPDAAVKLQEIESNERVKLQEMAVQQAANEMEAATKAAVSVNSTMQAEAASEHWPTYTWRPAIGFSVAFNTAVSAILVVGIYGGVMFGAPAATAALATLPMVLASLAAISATVMPILGIASWFRGKAQADAEIPAAIQLPMKKAV